MSRHALTAGLVLALALTAPFAWRHLRETPPTPPPPVSLTMTAPPGGFFGAGDDVLDAAVSPGGREVVFVATVDGEVSLWRRPLDSERAAPIPGTVGARYPAWSPDGGAVAFFAAGGLHRVTLSDGSVRRLAAAPAPGGALWLDEGLLFVPDVTGPIRHLADDATVPNDAPADTPGTPVGTPVTLLREGDRGHVFPGAAGRHGRFLYVAVRDDGRREVRLVRPDGEIDLTQAAGHAVVAGDHLLFVRSSTLLAQAVAPDGRLTGRSMPVAVDVGTSAEGRAFFAADDRLLLWAADAPRRHALEWRRPDGTLAETIAEPGHYWQVRLAPDDRQAAVTVLDPLFRTLDILLVPTTRGLPTRLTLGLAADTHPVWAPDGSRVLFRSLQSGQPELYSREVGATDAPDEPVLVSDLDESPTDWRGDTVLFQAPSARDTTLWSARVPGGTPTPAGQGGFSRGDARLDPSGDWLAYTSDESGADEVYVERWPDGSGRLRVSLAGGRRPVWRRDGRGLLFLREGQLMQLDITLAGDVADASAPRAVEGVTGVRDFDVAHRTDRVLVLRPVERSPAASSGSTVGATLDWRSALAADTTP
ncbi:MAG: TolB family protein [Vicinamibacterales bacterium]